MMLRPIPVPSLILYLYGQLRSSEWAGYAYFSFHSQDTLPSRAFPPMRAQPHRHAVIDRLGCRAEPNPTGLGSPRHPCCLIQPAPRQSGGRHRPVQRIDRGHTNIPYVHFPTVRSSTTSPQLTALGTVLLYSRART